MYFSHTRTTNYILLQVSVPCTKKYYSPQIRQTRSFWEYVNMMFNKPDPARILLVGPDRACAEWVLRNGGKVVWTDGKRLEDYNNLPAEEIPVPKLKEIDGSDSSISHYGFAHLGTKISFFLPNVFQYLTASTMCLNFQLDAQN